MGRGIGGLFHKRHEPDDVALRMDITGTCRRCRHHTTATLTAYWSGEILIRCKDCRQTNAFDADPESWREASRYLPWRNDEDDERQKR